MASDPADQKKREAACAYAASAIAVVDKALVRISAWPEGGDKDKAMGAWSEARRGYGEAQTRCQQGWGSKDIKAKNAEGDKAADRGRALEAARQAGIDKKKAEADAAAAQAAGDQALAAQKQAEADALAKLQRDGEAAGTQWYRRPTTLAAAGAGLLLVGALLWPRRRGGS